MNGLVTAMALAGVVLPAAFQTFASATSKWVGNGLVVSGNSFVTCNGHLDKGGARNTTRIGKDSVLY